MRWQPVDNESHSICSIIRTLHPPAHQPTPVFSVLSLFIALSFSLCHHRIVWPTHWQGRMSSRRIYTANIPVLTPIFQVKLFFITLSGFHSGLNFLRRLSTMESIGCSIPAFRPFLFPPPPPPPPRGQTTRIDRNSSVYFEQ